MSFQRRTTIGSMPLANSDATASRTSRSPSFSRRWISTSSGARSAPLRSVRSARATCSAAPTSTSASATACSIGASTWCRPSQSAVCSASSTTSSSAVASACPSVVSNGARPRPPPLRRWMMSCVTRSPCCSQRYNSRASSARSGKSKSRSRSNRLARWTLRPDSSTRSRSSVSTRRSRTAVSLAQTAGRPPPRSRVVRDRFTSSQQPAGAHATRSRPVEASRHDHDETLTVAELEIRLSDGLVLAARRPLTLSLRELRLLIVLAERVDRIVPREELYRLAWGRPLRDGDRSVDVYVHKLRAKLEHALPEWRFIHTHFGFRYRLSVEVSHAFHTTPTARQQAAHQSQGENTT